VKTQRLLWLSSPVLTLVALGAFTSSASAITPGTSGFNSAMRHANDRIVKELHAAKALLEKADHDYDGHRAKAVHHITEAIHELNGHHQQQHHKTSTAQHTQHHNSGKKMKEPQNVSDAQLREAAALVAKAQSQLGSTHPKVQAQLTLAEKELATALKIR
jgi:hypothetical protein